MHFTVEAQNIAKRFLYEGAVAIDATVGNGFDTLFLAQWIGSQGVVYGVDIQADAIQATHHRLEKEGMLGRTRLTIQSHSELMEVVDPAHVGEVAVVMFNLGYLPFGNKSIVTTASTTLAALCQAKEMLRPGGLLSILAYPGHLGGSEETQQITAWVHGNSESFDVERFQDSGNTNSPILWALTKNQNRN
jgi:predicted methyltransferase